MTSTYSYRFLQQSLKVYTFVRFLFTVFFFLTWQHDSAPHQLCKSTQLTAYLMCSVLSVYSHIVVYTSTFRVFTLLWKYFSISIWDSPSLRLSRFTKACPRVLSPFNQLNTFPGIFCDDWRRQPGLFALLLFGRTDRRMDGWMDVWVSKRKLTPFNNFIYFCIYGGIDRRQLITSSTGRLSAARIYSETHSRVTVCCTE